MDSYPELEKSLEGTTDIVEEIARVLGLSKKEVAREIFRGGRAYLPMHEENANRMRNKALSYADKHGIAIPQKYCTYFFDIKPDGPFLSSIDQITEEMEDFGLYGKIIEIGEKILNYHIPTAKQHMEFHGIEGEEEDAMEDIAGEIGSLARVITIGDYSGKINIMTETIDRFDKLYNFKVGDIIKLRHINHVDKSEWRNPFSIRDDKEVPIDYDFIIYSASFFKIEKNIECIWRSII